MAGDEEDRRIPTRPSIKSHVSFNNYPKWKDKLRENCYKRVRDDRTRLLWKMRLPASRDYSLKHKEFMKLTFQDIVSDELRKIKETPLNDCFENSISDAEVGEAIWESDGLHSAYQGECEEILLEMQRIFYEDLRTEEIGKEPGGCIKTWEDEEDEYLAHAVFEHMQLKDDKVRKEVWCPVCKQGELKENLNLIYCTRCVLQLNRGDEVTLELLRDRLAEAHAEHLERGCNSMPKFCLESRFGLSALYMKCQICSTFEVLV